MPSSIQSVLVEFEPARARLPALPQETAGTTPAPGSPLVAAPGRDLAAAEEAGFARGRAEALAEALADAERRIAAAREEALEQARAEHAEALVRAREEWADAEGAALAAALDRGLADMEAAVARKTARALRPFLREAVRDKAVCALCATLTDLLRSGPSATLRMSGPEDLLDAVMRRISGFDGKIAVSVTDAPDIRVVCDETTIETQIALWARSLAILDE
ncbi:MAG: hypothetical protein EA385_13710 [Salinarimonadaceae bacterium]|nr:MAG: hypothetical protein EA385_13710 [Salinarimonadaceae bacterium]